MLQMPKETKPSKLVEVTVVVLILAIIAGFIYGGWRLKRWWNWKWDYQSQARTEIREELEPLKKELKKLKERVADLEKECSQPKSE